jgi:hypothetical protein
MTIEKEKCNNKKVKQYREKEWWRKNTNSSTLRSDVLAVTMKIRPTDFWDVTPCSPVEVNGRLGTYCLHLQGRRLSQVA